MYNENIQDDYLKDYLKFYTEESFYDNYRYALENGDINIFCNDHMEFRNFEFNSEHLIKSRIINKENSRDNVDIANNELHSSEDKFIFDLYDVFSLDKIKDKSNFKIYKLGVTNETENI